MPSVTKRIKYMKQSVQLKGLGDNQFEEAIKAAGMVCDHFSSEFAEGRLERWADQYVGQEENLLSLANRIFTPVNELGKKERHIPLPKELDPYSVAEKIVQKGFVTTDDNFVQYTRGVTEARGNSRVR
ncbi:hypothetical protein H0H93_005980, partial [Arthromyces matolae]